LGPRRPAPAYEGLDGCSSPLGKSAKSPLEERPSRGRFSLRSKPNSSVGEAALWSLAVPADSWGENLPLDGRGLCSNAIEPQEILSNQRQREERGALKRAIPSHLWMKDKDRSFPKGQSVEAQPEGTETIVCLRKKAAFTKSHTLKFKIDLVFEQSIGKDILNYIKKQTIFCF
jgi:hypothetical protein